MMHYRTAIIFLCCFVTATKSSTENAASCWLTHGGVCVKTGNGDGCPFENGWFSWLYCPVGYHCCAPPRAGETPPIDRSPLAPCGNRSGYRGDGGHVAMVIGGSAAEPGDWPWMAQIRVARKSGLNSWEQHCGGVLVHPEWLVSAGHCFAWAEPSDAFSLHVGHSVLPDASQQAFNASRIIVHEKFFLPRYSNDIALVKLDRPARLDPMTYPICLPEPGETFDNSVGCIAGWGATSDSGTSDRLMETQLPMVSTVKCKHLYADANRPVYPENICAGFMAGGRDACHGDSGGPLMIRRDGLWLAAGVVSHGEGCGLPGKPGVYTALASYAAWIRSHVTAG